MNKLYEPMDADHVSLLCLIVQGKNEPDILEEFKEELKDVPYYVKRTAELLAGDDFDESDDDRIVGLYNHYIKWFNSLKPRRKECPHCHGEGWI